MVKYIIIDSMVGHRYNLRPASAKEIRQRLRASQASLPKRRPASPITATTTTTVPSTDADLLYQTPQKWTLAHLRATNLQHETGVSWEQIVDARYTPSDCDPGTQRTKLSYYLPFSNCQHQNSRGCLLAFRILS